MQIEHNMVAPSGQRYPNLNYYYDTLWFRAYQIIGKNPLNGTFLCCGNVCSSISAAF